MGDMIFGMMAMRRWYDQKDWQRLSWVCVKGSAWEAVYNRLRLSLIQSQRVEMQMLRTSINEEYETWSR